VPVRVTVIGAGIVGLTSALRLREAGHQVRIVAEHTGERTTSAVAAALWFPYLAAPHEAVTRWAATGLQVLTEFAGNPATGVDLRTGRELYRGAGGGAWWASVALPARRLTDPEVPAGFAAGVELTVPVVDSPVHLSWLTERLTAMNVPFSTRRLRSLDDAGDGVDLLVNCAGLGAREVAADPGVHPVRGQVVLLDQVGLGEWTLDDSDPVDLTYVVPRRSAIVVGGTAERGDDDVRPRPETTAAILRRATALVPELAGARVLGQRVGLRPARAEVRLERCGDVVHCYGHGGAGVTLAYGCAEDVVRLANQVRP
jgi:D-amino-acid oxidase